MNETKLVEILLVEDNPSDLGLIQRALEKVCLANQSAVVRNGFGALELLFGSDWAASRSEGNPPKVILLDLDRPETDGFRILQRLKRNPRTKAIPVVALTSSKARDDEWQGHRMAANGFVVKPVNFDEFDTAVQELGKYWLLLL